MKSILQALYDGEIYPAEQLPPLDEATRKVHQEYSNHCDDFQEALQEIDPPLASQFEKIMGEQLEELSHYLAETFIDGFRYGARMMLEVFQCDIPHEKKPFTP